MSWQFFVLFALSLCGIGGFVIAGVALVVTMRDSDKRNPTFWGGVGRLVLSLFVVEIAVLAIVWLTALWLLNTFSPKAMLRTEPLLRFLEWFTMGKLN